MGIHAKYINYVVDCYLRLTILSIALSEKIPIDFNNCTFFTPLFVTP